MPVFPLAIKTGPGEQGEGDYEGAVSREKEENPKKGHCYWGYACSARQDEHKAAAVQGRVGMDSGKLRIWPLLCVGLVLGNLSDCAT